MHMILNTLSFLPSPWIPSSDGLLDGLTLPHHVKFPRESVDDGLWVEAVRLNRHRRVSKVRVVEDAAACLHLLLRLLPLKRSSCRTVRSLVGLLVDVSPGAPSSVLPPLYFPLRTDPRR